MEIVVDASAVLAVVLDEPERDSILRQTEGATLVAPTALPYEIGNALTALVKRDRLDQGEALKAWGKTQEIPCRLFDIDIEASLHLSLKSDSYAYDGYYLQCSLARRRPLLTLDRKLRRVATDLGITVLL